jgi:hypothetical protein
MKLRRVLFVLCCAALALTTIVRAADPPKFDAAEVQRLKDLLAKQQEQIEILRAALAEQKKMLDGVTSDSAATNTTAVHATPADRLIASTTPMLTPGTSSATPPPRVPPPAPLPQADGNAAPLQIKIGNVGIMPVGFMDMTLSWKDKNAGGSLGSNFGSVPYNNVAASKLSEFRFSPQNSRLGFRIDGDFKGAHFIGYNEFDFLGSSGSNNLSVTNGAFVPRIRLYWVDVRKGQWEFLGGQSWSMLTPNRKGISALPGDLFYSQVIDVNYMAGLTWTRQPGVRVLYHPSKTVTWGLSFENPEAYIGGSAGGSTIVLPTALGGLAPSQLDNAGAQQATPNVHPDIISKLALDPNSRVHFEIAGIYRTFKIWNTTTGQPTSGQYSTKGAGGGSINANFEIVKNLRLVTNNYWSDGGGRYLFGQAPDTVVRADGTLSPVHSGGMVQGFELTHKNSLLYAYYGGIYIGRNVAVDTNGSLVGYGYRGSSNGQNRAIQEVSFGFNQTIWKDAKYGALNLMGQYEYLTRAPWFVATNAPKATHDNTIYFNIRYTLPGGPPPAPVEK